MESSTFDLSFSRTYEIEGSEWPGDGRPIIYQSGRSSGQGKDGILLRFRPRGAAEWLGCFAFGHQSYAFSGVFTTPNPEYACVISKGTAYWVNAREPANCNPLQFVPVLAAKALAKEKVLLLANFITLALVGADGAVWRSPRLCWDDLRIMSIENGIVRGVGSDPINSCDAPFEFDVKSRRVLRTSYPKELDEV